MVGLTNVVTSYYVGDFLYITSKQYEKRRKSSNSEIPDLGVWHKFGANLALFLPHLWVQKITYAYELLNLSSLFTGYITGVSIGVSFLLFPPKDLFS